MKKQKSDPVYHSLIVIAKARTDIWLVDEDWHLVQKAVGSLKTSLLPGNYFVELGKPSRRGIAYPIALFGNLRFSEAKLKAGPTCPRQPPKMLGKNAGDGE